MIKNIILKTGSYRNIFAFFIWLAITYIIAFFLMVSVTSIFSSGKELTEKAISNSQTFFVNVATGKLSESNSKITENNKKNENTPTSNPDKSSINTIISKEGGLNPAPIASLIEQLNKFSLPITSADGTKAWKYYARPYNGKENKPVIAIIFTNLALSKNLTEETLKLPHDFTLGFSPYASDSRKWATKAREEGFETIIDLPMQAENFPLSDPGPFGLMEDLSKEDNNNRLYNILSQLSVFVGVTASLDEKLTANNEFIKSYLLELKKRGILFIYLKNDKNKAIADLTKDYGLYTLGIDRIIDKEISISAIESELQMLTEIAKTNGYAIGVAHSYPPTLETLTKWSETLKSQGVDLAPVSAIASRIYHEQ
ncbi:MAG: divergent polysaccharide deacetylase family protein [Pseudomonadota bacterium]